MEYYVYVLYINDMPFYAGMTYNPFKRYKEHYQDGYSPVYGYTRYMAVEYNKMMIMKIVYICQTIEEARKIEIICIELLIKAGFFIYNRCNTIGKYSLIPTYPIISRLSKSILKKANLAKYIIYE